MLVFILILQFLYENSLSIEMTQNVLHFNFFFVCKINFNFKLNYHVILMANPDLEVRSSRRLHCCIVYPSSRPDL
jgi:ABC-type uncharacterized transport system permease subunit